MKMQKANFVPNLAYGKLQYAIKVYRDYFYNHCICTDRFGCYVGENDEKIEFIISEGYKPTIKRFKSKKKAEDWLKSNSWKLWPGRNAHVVKLQTVDEIRRLKRRFCETFTKLHAFD